LTLIGRADVPDLSAANPQEITGVAIGFSDARSITCCAPVHIAAGLTRRWHAKVGPIAFPVPVSRLLLFSKERTGGGFSHLSAD